MNIALLQETGRAMPFGLPALFYGALGALVVHLCQQLVEETSNAIDPASRVIRTSRAAFSIGGLVWVLDVTGFFIYPDLSTDGLPLTPALLGLLINSFSARLTVPTLSTDTHAGRVCLAALGLALGMLLGHAVLSFGFVPGTLTIEPSAFAASLALAVLLAAGLALKHRKARLSAIGSQFTPLTWRLKILAGMLIPPLHWCLVTTFPLPSSTELVPNSSAHLLITVLAFGLAITADQLQAIHSERRRQRSFRNVVTPGASSVAASQGHDRQLALISARLPELLHPKQLQIHFQPIVTPHQPKAHFEALLRVSDPVLGRINPEKFILACTLQAQGAHVDMLIIGNALDHLADWTRQGFDSATININVSPATLLEADFVDWIHCQLQQRELAPSRVRLEITEHALIANGGEMVRIIRQLKAKGIGVIMDDFGSGYSSLGLLADLPISGFKCDRLFIKGLVQDTRRQALLKKIAELAVDLGIPVTAEGVETREELDIVMQSGIASVQGYYFAKPMPAPDIPAWFAGQAW
ncbi:EAL domain-containing protein [Paludibacterium purpuratum]|uniref:EAL domain-containing protein (Putative c-di-GMP-specific phosphodiesterase class I) n=1 Tax=Paludibacterium purpuratum TaxID=1144873 RepID=A0A4R7AW29_9NEIS|nr:EAL domain-containing protein [Paludibacterium purpuratum]TDR71597.1 EAL domain-containing protein (putative c-di-GMP-specific phosphodiesterase class I) [Paludibacterium purpuratum]